MQLFLKNMWFQIAKEAFNLVYLHILPSLSPLMTRQIKFSYSKIILIKCLESDHNTVKVTSYDWQKKEKDVSGMESWSWYFRQVYICIRPMASLKSGRSGGSSTASGIRVKHSNLKRPILKENKNKTSVNTAVQAEWLYYYGKVYMENIIFRCSVWIAINF